MPDGSFYVIFCQISVAMETYGFKVKPKTNIDGLVQFIFFIKVRGWPVTNIEHQST